MAVFVDDMHKYPMGRFRRMKMSHMSADSTGDLLAMADRIGLPRKWLQKPGQGAHVEHFDVCLSMRRKAVAAGAREVTWEGWAHLDRTRQFDTR